MLSGEFLDRLAAEVRKVRGDEASPFGGIQRPQRVTPAVAVRSRTVTSRIRARRVRRRRASAEVTNQLGPLFCARGRCFQSRCFCTRSSTARS